MTTTRRAHSRRTPSGRRTRVRRHRVDAATTARNLWEASGITRLLSLDRGRYRIDEGIEALQTRRKAAGWALMTAGVTEIGAVLVGGAARTLALAGLAAVFAAVGLLVSGYRPPKPKKSSTRTAKPAARPVHRFADQPRQPARRQTRRASEEFGPTDRGRRRTDEVS